MRRLGRLLGLAPLIAVLAVAVERPPEHGTAWIVALVATLLLAAWSLGWTRPSAPPGRHAAGSPPREGER